MTVGDEQVICGGRRDDGSECDCCEFGEYEGFGGKGMWKVGHRRDPSFSKSHWGYLREGYCPECGTLLGVADDGEPTREPELRVRAEAWLADAEHLLAGFCPPTDRREIEIERNLISRLLGKEPEDNA